MCLKFISDRTYRRKVTLFGSIQAGLLLSQIILCFMIVIYIWLSFLGIVPGNPLLIGAVIYVVSFVILSIIASRYMLRPKLQSKGRSDAEAAFLDKLKNERFTVICTICENYMSFFIENNERKGEIVRYLDIARMYSFGKNLFFSVSGEKTTKFYLIPAEAFSSASEYKETKRLLRNAVKRQRRPEIKHTIIGSFLKGMARAWLWYVWMCIKMFLITMGLLVILVIVVSIVKWLK